MGMTDIDYDLIKAPPHSKEAEQSVLGAVMLDEEILDDLSGKIGADDFYYPQHREIFKAMLSMGGQPIDVVTISEVMEENNSGVDLDYLVELAKNTPSTANALTYAQIVTERSKERQLISVGQLFSEVCHDRSLSHHDRIEQAQIAFNGLSSETDADTLSGIKSLLERSLDSIDRRFNGQEDTSHIKTGLSKVDERIHGYRPADLVLVGARPSMGKTTFMTNVAKYAAMRHGPVLIFSLEMTSESLTDRLIASCGGIHVDLIRNPKKSNNDQEFWPKLTNAVNQMKDLPIMIDDQGGLSVFELKSRARRQHRKTPLSMVMVDYLGKLNDGSRNSSDSRNTEISTISGELKLLAKELDCPVVALSQLNRNLENRPDKRPKNADLRDSGSLEQDADIIQFLYRDEVYNEQSEFKGVLEIITSKFREGEIGTDRVLFEGQYNRISDLDSAKFMQQQAAERPNNKKYSY